MKEFIEKNYCLCVCDIYPFLNGYIVLSDGINYYCVKSDFNDLYFDELLSFINVLKGKGVILHDLIKGVDGKYCNEGWVLLKLNCFIENVNYVDLCKFYEVRNFSIEFSNKYKDLYNVWSEKIDYLEYQVSELSECELINMSFDYYVGFVELLMQYFKNNIIWKYNEYLGLCHRKMSFNTVEFYNPLNIVVDIYIRDLALYVRKTKDYSYLKSVLKEREKDYAYYYLFVKLLLPFEYFDIIQDYLINKTNKDKLDEFLDIDFEYILTICDLFEDEEIKKVIKSLY